jgi:SNF2 family DNA or RNA helicase
MCVEYATSAGMTEPEPSPEEEPEPSDQPFGRPWAFANAGLDWLWEYQQSDVMWMLQHPMGINGNEHGLGKTVEAGAVLKLLRRDNVLILGKGILGFQWQDELREKFDLDLEVVTGTGAKAVRSLQVSPWVYTNYAKLRVQSSRKALLARRWDVVIIDESHRIKGRNSQQAEGLKGLKTERMYFLTASPMPNGSPSEMFLWLQKIDPKTFSSYWNFVKQYCIVEQTEWGIKVGAARDERQVAQLLMPYMIRRLREDVARQLPPLLLQRIRHALSPRQRAMYTQMTKAFIISTKRGPSPQEQVPPDSEMEDLDQTAAGWGQQEEQWDEEQEDVEAQNTAVRWSHLRKICLTPILYGEEDNGGKLEALDALLEEILPTGRKVVVYTWHRRFAEIVWEHIINKGEHRLPSGGYIHEGLSAGGDPTAGLVHGGFDTDDQVDTIRHFKEKTGGGVLVATIASLGEGLNLQEASAVIFLEISYVPEENRQALRRVHREGQTQSVNAYILVAKGTIEDLVFEHVQEKRESIRDFDKMRMLVQEQEAGNERN